MKEQYAWNAADYAKHSSAQQRWARELIAKLNLGGSESILDLGCGDGKVSAEIASGLTTGSVLGVDNSPEMIALAVRSFPVEDYPSLSFELADARSLPYQDRFKVVFSNAVLHWIKNHKPVIAGIGRSLIRGGRSLLQMGGKGNAAGIITVLNELMDNCRWKSSFVQFEFPYGFYDCSDYEPLLKAAGLRPTRIELIPKDMTYADSDGLAGWIRTTWLPYTNRVPAESKDEFIALLVRKYLEKYPADDDGTIHVKMIRLEVEAIKEQ